MYILMHFLKNLTEFFYTANNKDNFSYCFHNSVGDPMNTRRERYKLYAKLNYINVGNLPLYRSGGGNVTLGHNMFCIAETVFTNGERGTRLQARIE